MKLLLVHHAFPPEGVGGSELYTLSLARRLAGRHQLSVLHRSLDARRGDYDLRESERDGFRTLSVNVGPRPGLGFEAYRDPVLSGLVAGVLDDLRPDLVHVGHLSGLSTGVVFAARRRGIPVVLTLHDFWMLCPLGQLLNRHLQVCPGPGPRRCLDCVGAQVAATPRATARGRARGRGRVLTPLARLAARLGQGGPARIDRRLEEMREVLRAADALVSPSRFLRDRLEALGVAGISVLPNGHEPLSPPPRVPAEHGRLRVGFVGAAIPSKGLHVLAQAFRQLDAAAFELRVHGPFREYHGDTGYEARVRRILGPAAASALRGSFEPEDLGRILAELDVVAVPSIWEENAPLVVEEAFLARRPLVVSDHGGLAERVRHEVDGLRFRPGDPADLARALRRLAAEPALRARLGQDPPHVTTMEEHVPALEDIYRRAQGRFREAVGRVGVVVLDRDRPLAAARAADSVRDADVNPRVLIVRNGPGPEPAPQAGVERLELPENRGYAAGMNAGIALLRSLGCDRILLLNNDAVLAPGALRRLAEALSDHRVAAVAPVVLRAADGRVESRGARFNPRTGRQRLVGHGERWLAREARVRAESLPGAAWMLSASALDRVGPLDEEYFHFFEDSDWCFRARACGLVLEVVWGALARHEGGLTLGASSPQRLYYAARNHLRAAERLSPLDPPGRWLRWVAIVAQNVAHAVLRDGAPRLAGLAAVARGTLDFQRGRFGPGPA